MCVNYAMAMLSWMVFGIVLMAWEESWVGKLLWGIYWRVVEWVAYLFIVML